MGGREGRKKKEKIEKNQTQKKGGQKLSWKKDFFAVAKVRQQWQAQLLQEHNNKDYLKEDMREFQML